PDSISPLRMGLFDSFLKLSVNMAEAGLLFTDSAMKTAQASLERLAGIQNESGTAAPMSGPQHVDRAISDALNRAARILQITPLEWQAMPGAIRELVDATRTSFQFLDWRNPKCLLLPLQLPLSIATLMTESTLRGLASLQVVGADRYVDFL